MCGRFFIEDANGNHDVAPSDRTWIITGLQEKPCMVKWGYEGKNKGQLIINARAESVKQKPLFGRDYRKRRCVIPARGFYEWDRNKRRYSFGDGEGETEIFLAGICTGLPQDAGRFTILTVGANEQMKEIHHRMPVLIKKDEFAQWFGSVESADALLNEKILGKQSLSVKRGLEIDEINGKIGLYVQQSLTSYLGEQK